MVLEEFVEVKEESRECVKNIIKNLQSRKQLVSFKIGITYPQRCFDTWRYS